MIIFSLMVLALGVIVVCHFFRKKNDFKDVPNNPRDRIHALRYVSEDRKYRIALYLLHYILLIRPKRNSKLY